MDEIVDVSEANAILSLYGLQVKYDHVDWYVAQAGADHRTQHFSMWTRMYVDGGLDEVVAEILHNLADVYVYVGIKQLP
jgi:hypothetical protein